MGSTNNNLVLAPSPSKEKKFCPVVFSYKLRSAKTSLTSKIYVSSLNVITDYL